MQSEFQSYNHSLERVGTVATTIPKGGFGTFGMILQQTGGGNTRMPMRSETFRCKSSFAAISVIKSDCRDRVRERERDRECRSVT